MDAESKAQASLFPYHFVAPSLLACTSPPSSSLSGRLKGPEYVGLTTRVYRQAVDAAWEAMSRGDEDPQVALSTAKLAVQLEDRLRWDLEQVCV